MTPAMLTINTVQHQSYTSLVDAIGHQYFEMTTEQLQELEGNIGQLIIAQAVMFLKANYNLREAIPRPERDRNRYDGDEDVSPMVEAFRRVRANRIDTGAVAGEAQPARRRL